MTERGRVPYQFKFITPRLPLEWGSIIPAGICDIRKAFCLLKRTFFRGDHHHHHLPRCKERERGEEGDRGRQREKGEGARLRGKGEKMGRHESRHLTDDFPACLGASQLTLFIIGSVCVCVCERPCMHAFMCVCVCACVHARRAFLCEAFEAF